MDFFFDKSFRLRILGGVFLVSSLLSIVVVNTVDAANPTTVTWKVSHMTAGEVKKLSAFVTSNSPGVKTWSKTGQCSLTPKAKPTQLTMGKTGSCILKLTIAKSGNYSAKTSTKTVLNQIPARRTDLTKAKVLKTSTVRLAKVSGISSTSVQSASIHAYEFGDVIFKTSGIVAYAQADTASQSGSKLLALSTTGVVSDALLSGSAVITNFYSAPNGDVYIIFESKIALTTGGTPCLLAVVDVSNGVPTCVDSTLDYVNWSMSNSPIQLDSSGAIYYTGTSGSDAVLRKVKDGVITNLLQGNVYLNEFIVLSNGTVLLTGMTMSTGVSWIRRISATGALKNLAITSATSFWKFVDGKVYAGLTKSNSSIGIKRYSVERDALEDKYWITWSSNNDAPGSYFNTDRFVGNIAACTEDGWGANSSFCYSSGQYVNKIFNVIGQKTFGVTDYGNRQLWQYYPTVEKSNVTAIESVTVAQQIITTIILAGTSATGTNIMSLYDTSSKQETVVMNGSNEVEIYSMSYSQRSNSILFTGLRFSDNKYIVGEVSLG